MREFRLRAALAACLILLCTATPAAGKEPEKRSEKKRAESRSPYSNESVRRDREALRQERAARKDAEPSHYQFRSPRPG